MARPTNEPKNKLIKARISEEMYEKIGSFGENKSDVIRNIIEEFVTQNSNVTHNKSNVIQKDNSSVTQNKDNYVTQYEHLKDKFNTLSTRVRPEAQELWSNEIYTGLEICKIGNLVNDDLEIMLASLGMTLDEFLTEAHDKLESGALTIENGEIIVNECPFNFDKFIEACNEKGVDYQKAIDKATQMVWRG